MTKDLSRLLAPFTFRDLQQALTVFAYLEDHGATMADLGRHVQTVIKQHKRRAAARKARDDKWKAYLKENLPECPACGQPLTLSPGDANDCHWTCRACRWGKYIDRPASEVLQELTIKPFAG